MGCNGLQWDEFCGITPPPQKNDLKERAAICGNGKLFGELPLIKIATYECAAMDCNEKNFEELSLTNIEI